MDGGIELYRLPEVGACQHHLGGHPAYVFKGMMSSLHFQPRLLEKYRCHFVNVVDVKILIWGKDSLSLVRTYCL